VKNVAKVASRIAILGEVEQRIIACFGDGGGVPYSLFPRFHAVRAEEACALIDASLVDEILPLVEGLPERPRAGVELADFGCGSGHAINVMAQAFPASQFTGIDFSEPAVAAARVESASLGVSNATFLTQDLALLDLQTHSTSLSRSMLCTIKSSPPVCWRTFTACYGLAARY